MRFVDCYYRVTEQGEIMRGTFDLVRGCINEFPELMKLDIASMFKYYDANYSNGKVLLNATLVDILCQRADALVVVN